VILNDVLGAGPKRVKRFRVGRGPGSGAGKTCGRGQHGAYSRSGNSIKLGFQGGTMRFFRRLPRRGFSNAMFRVEWDTVNVGQLEKAFQAGETVTLALAIERGVVKRNSERLKVLGDGELTKALTLDPAVAVSAPARVKIEKAGGKVGMPLPKKEPPSWRRIAAEKERAEKAKAEAARAESAKAEKAKGDKPKGEKAKAEGGEKAAKGEAKPAGERPPKGDHPKGDHPKGEKSGGEKPAGDRPEKAPKAQKQDDGGKAKGGEGKPKAEGGDKKK
jgi:large subunit ribosomal protein L15